MNCTGMQVDGSQLDWRGLGSPQGVRAGIASFSLLISPLIRETDQNGSFLTKTLIARQL
jgi:hypothetical protein